VSLPRYRVIYADPPWSYDDAGVRGGVDHHYPTLDADALATLPVHLLAEPDAVLFMWATYPLLPDALRTMAAWGFTYKTIAFQWVKQNRKADTDFVGMGRWTRGNTEPCLLGVRGKPKRTGAASVRQVVRAPVAKHSAKPPEVRDRIVDLLGDVPRIELFAREQADGWESTGLDLDGLDLRDVLKAYEAEKEADK
jgi:N6-adenosine-specific RNA methylase IME4